MPRIEKDKFVGYYVIYFDLDEQIEKRKRFPVYSRALDMYLIYSADKKNYGYVMLVGIIAED